MSRQTLAAELRAVLDPLSDEVLKATPQASDYDLNPSIRPDQTRPLRPAAVLVPVIWREPGATVLLTRRADTLNSHTGQVAFPGGRIEPGETVVEAALREAHEEVGLDPAKIHPLGLSDVYETGTGFCVTPVVAVVDTPFELTLNPDEVAVAFETPWDFLMDTGNYRKESMVWNGAERWFWAMRWDDIGTERYIWGATAGMIRRLQQRMARLSGGGG